LITRTIRSRPRNAPRKPAAQPFGALSIGTGKRHARIVVPALKEIRVGVDIGASVHLLTAFEANGRTVVARSAALQKYAARAQLGEVSDQPLAKAQSGSIARMLDIKGLRARDVARALGGPAGAQHLLRLTLTSPEGKLIGGYSIVGGA